MKTKFLIVVAVLLVMASAAYAQTGFAGKWVTDPPAAGAGGGRGGGGETRLDLKVDGSKLTGTIFEGGAELMINEGHQRQTGQVQNGPHEQRRQSRRQLDCRPFRRQHHQSEP